MGDLNMYRKRTIWPEALRTNRMCKWQFIILFCLKSWCHLRASLFVRLGGKKLVSLWSWKNHKALKFIAPIVSHQTFMNTEVVPSSDSGINTNDTILESICTTTIVAGADLVKLRKTNGLVDSGCPISIWVFPSLSFASVRIDVEKRT